MKHLKGGVAKGAFTQEDADVKFEAWKSNKTGVSTTVKSKEQEAKKAAAAQRLAAEVEYNKAKMAELAKKNAPIVVAEPKPEVAAEPEAVAE